MVSGSRDMFNRLPDPLLSHIISFLSTKEAASTSLLSKRWRYLLAFVPNLEFDYSERRVENRLGGFPCMRLTNIIGGKRKKLFNSNKKRKKLSTSFPDFVDRILELQGKYPVHKFFLKIEDGYDPDCFSPWIYNVLARGVSDLHLVVVNKDWSDSWSDSTLPSRIFLSETLVRLRIKVGARPAYDNLGNVHLPKLKILHLEYVSFKQEDIGFSKLLSGCPVLEELIVDTGWPYTGDPFSFSVTTLRRLRFRGWHFDGEDEKPNSVSFDTPNLVYLEYSEVIADQYPKVKLDSLAEAKIDLLESVTGNATDFIMGISNVHTLYLSADTFVVLTLCCKAIPIFRNLTHLTIQSKPQVGWESLPGLLKNCPKLETLVLQGLRHKATDRCGDLCLCKPREEDVPSCLSSSLVKVLKIFTNDDKIKKQIEQVKHFFETMPHLEQLVLYYDPSFDENVEVVTQFQMLTTAKVASPKCKVQLIPNNR